MFFLNTPPPITLLYSSCSELHLFWSIALNDALLVVAYRIDELNKGQTLPCGPKIAESALFQPLNYLKGGAPISSVVLDLHQIIPCAFEGRSSA